MNPERINAVADAIEQHAFPLGFNMQYYCAATGQETLYGTLTVDQSGHNCGTTVCIAGWGYAVMVNAAPTPERYFSPTTIRQWMGLEHDQAFDLFHAQGRSGNLFDVSQAQAVRTLRHLAATGTVDWTV